MINLYPFLFRFGSSFNYPIPPEIIQYLYDYFTDKYSIVINQTKKDFDCVAVKDKEAESDSTILVSKFENRLKEYPDFDLESSILFLDLSRVYHDKFTDKLLSDILMQIQNKRTRYNGFPNFILFVDSLDEKSTTLSMLFKVKFSENDILDRCFIFDKEGQFVNSNLEIEQDDTLPKLIKQLSTSLVEKLEFKLVRKINHFKRKKDNVWNACQQFFYDGVNCQKEAVELLKEKLLRISNEANMHPQYIVYDSLHSQWLSDAVLAVSNNISSWGQKLFFNYKCSINLRDGKEQKNADDWIDNNNVDIIFISDLINTGSTFKKRIRKVCKKFPNASIHCISALITNKAYTDFHNDSVDHEQQITIDDNHIDFFIKVEQKYYNDNSGENANSCPMCKHNLLPAVDVNIDISEKLSSYEMWFMCEEAGYKVEDYQPRENRKNRIVPHSKELFIKNGTLLSIKFEKQLEINIAPSDEVVVLFPDETQNNYEGISSSQIETTPSGYFAKRLNLYNDNYTYIPIPRSLIRTIEKGVSLDTITDLQHCKILSQIRNIDIDNPIVVIDEVNYTGTTFKGIADILHFLDKEPSCYFPIFNFDVKGTSSKYNIERFKDVKFLNLYEFAYE